MIELRDYQRAAIDALYAWFRAGRGSPLVVAPTGSGKSVILAEFARSAVVAYPETRILIVTHMRELIAQNHAALIRLWPDAPAGIYSAGLGKRQLGRQVLVAGVQSVARRARELGHVDLAIVDEAHLVPRSSDTQYGRLFDGLRVTNPNLKVIGLTATPYRLDSGLLHGGENALFEILRRASGGHNEEIARPPYSRRAMASDWGASRRHLRWCGIVPGHSLCRAADRRIALARSPEPGPSWSDVRAATIPGAACIQGPQDPPAQVQSEDCLYLNVRRPASTEPGAKLPVMVWIHGGGLAMGVSTDPLYDSTHLARRGVLIVSFNYRLGRLGFFAHPALSAENPDGPLGGYGTMDQIAALEWVKSNIAALGGDPDNVTILGESSGGVSVNTLMVSPLARGLFTKAITQSGRGRDDAFPLRGLDDAPPTPEQIQSVMAMPYLLGQPVGTLTGEMIGMAHAATLGITGTDAEALKALRAVPAQQFTASAGSDVSVGAMIDGKLLVESVHAAFAGGREARVPTILGANSCERCGVAAIEDNPEAVLALAGGLRDRMVAVYGEEPKSAAVNLASDVDHVEPARHLARLHARNGQSTWVYNFGHRPPSWGGRFAGVPHAAEISFVFGTLRDGKASAFGLMLVPTPEDLRVSDTMMTYWTSFAKTSDPETAMDVRWPGFDAATETVLTFTTSGPQPVPHFRKERLDLVEQIATGAN